MKVILRNNGLERVWENVKEVTRYPGHSSFEFYESDGTRHDLYPKAGEVVEFVDDRNQKDIVPIDWEARTWQLAQVLYSHCHISDLQTAETSIRSARTLVDTYKQFIKDYEL